MLKLDILLKFLSTLALFAIAGLLFLTYTQATEATHNTGAPVVDQQAAALAQQSIAQQAELITEIRLIRENLEAGKPDSTPVADATEAPVTATEAPDATSAVSPAITSKATPAAPTLTPAVPATPAHDANPAEKKAAPIQLKAN